MKPLRLLLLACLIGTITHTFPPALSHPNISKRVEFRTIIDKIDQQTTSFDNPNLDERDGFDEAEYEQKIQLTPQEKQYTDHIAPILERNL